MKKKPVSLRGLRTFCIAARHESFRDAAERTFVTASAVSHQIKNLEEELGLQLFERSARQLKLTEVGSALFDEVSPLITEIEETVAAYRVNAEKSILNISVQPFFASELFVPRLPEFSSAHADTEIRIDTSDESAERHSGKSDASIRIFSAPPAGLVADRLFSLKLIPAGSPEFKKSLKIKGKTITSEFPLIMHDGRSKAWKHWSKRTGIQFPKDSTNLRLASMIAIVRAAERGLGAALVPMQLSDSWFASGALVPLFDAPLETDDAYYFVCDHDSADIESVRLLRDWVNATFAESPRKDAA